MSAAESDRRPCRETHASGSSDDHDFAEEFRSKLVWIARSRYHVRADAAEDIVQATFATYLQVRHRYTHVADQRAILTGIFRNKCLAHIERSVREKRSLERYLSTPDAIRDNPWVRPGSPGLSPSVLDELVRRETRTGILKAIARLRPSSRRLASMLALGRLGRKDLILQLGLNKNTLDSRLHACRTELRGLLRENELGTWRARTHRPHRAGRSAGDAAESVNSAAADGFGSGSAAEP